MTVSDLIRVLRLLVLDHPEVAEWAVVRGQRISDIQPRDIRIVTTTEEVEL